MADTPAVLPLPGDGSPSAGGLRRDRTTVDLASRGAGPPAASADQVVEPGRAAAPSPVRSQVDATLTASFHRAVDLQKQITDILFDTNCKVTNHHRSLILGHLRELIQECADLRAVAARQCGRADELCDQLERTRATGAGVSPGVAPTTSPPASYAAVVRGGVPVRGAPGAAGPSPGTVVPPGGAADSAIRRDHAHIMFFTPLVPTSTAADDLSAAMKNNVDLVKERIGDISVRKTPRGLTILSDDKESMDRLRAALESNVVTNTTMSIWFAQKRKPHVKLTGVDPDVPAVNLIAQLNARNPTLTVDPSTCSVRTSFKERSGNFTHVLEVDPPTFRSLMARGRVAVGMFMSLRAPSVRHMVIPAALALCDSRRTGPCARAAQVTTSQLNVRSVWVAWLCAAMNAAMRALTARTRRATNLALSWSAELLVCGREPTMADAPGFSTGATRGGLGAFWAGSAVRGCADWRALSPWSSAHSGPPRLSLHSGVPRFLVRLSFSPCFTRSAYFWVSLSMPPPFRGVGICTTSVRSREWANMDHTRDATKLLVEHMTRGGFAFAFVSDPYTCADRIPNVPPTITIFHAPARPRVMLLARAPGFDLFPLYLSQLVVAVSCEGPGQSFILVATYAPPHRPLDPILDELAQCFSRFPVGFSLCSLPAPNELRVLNSPDSPPTFDTPYASSWIDVSLASISLTRAGFAWSVSDSDTLSDHRYLEFSFSGMPGVRKKRLTNFARAQILDSLDRSVWFDRVVGCRFSSCLALDLVLAQFYRLYDALHTRNLRAVKPRATSGNAWWTPQLAAERSRVRAMRRRLQRTRDPALRTVFRAQYARTFASYKRNIRHAKDTFDRSLCQELTTRNLFGDPFKLAFAKLSPPTHLPPLFQSDGNLTSSVLSSAALLLRVHVGADDPAEDTEFHRRVRCVVDAPYPSHC
ncbi:hypothetical protein HPB49_000143 [Dermacentor silvarum]|uniref:Uncharacterized protein n=1 Tax=Dermacentor silvarum TaxID=543639 RepID=A0ACB8D9D2_DERSI|nr:hypothetical protein HPB49_000143 [Dermacentor silvarum]